MQLLTAVAIEMKRGEGDIRGGQRRRDGEETERDRGREIGIWTHSGSVQLGATL